MELLPEGVRDEVDAALREPRERTQGASAPTGGERIESVASIGGGCINDAARVVTDAGSSFFLKWNRDAPPEMFVREAEGLAALGAAGTLRVPEPIAWGTREAGAPGWLLLEYIEPGRSHPDTDGWLGEGLAKIHEGSGRARFGWAHDNWIGSLPQSNGESRSWGAFWRSRRLKPQLALARERGHLRDEIFDRVLDVTPSALAGVTKPDLVHGDLWSGNAFPAADGRPVIIDPAVYAGHGEVDLAMSELFGGFGSGFYDAYHRVRPITAEYGAYRRALYQLYYLLVHVNLFGGSYVAPSRRAAGVVLAELT